MVALVLMDSGLGERIRALREAREWSQEQLAIRAKVKRSWVSVVEIGQTKEPRALDLDRIARALGTDVHYLLTGETDASDPVKEAALNRLGRLSRDAVLQIEMAFGHRVAEASAEYPPEDEQPKGSADPPPEASK